MFFIVRLNFQNIKVPPLSDHTIGHPPGRWNAHSLEDLVEIEARSGAHTVTGRATLSLRASSSIQNRLLASPRHDQARPNPLALQLSTRPSWLNWHSSKRTEICAMFSFLVPFPGIVVVPLPQWVELFGIWTLVLGNQLQGIGICSLPFPRYPHLSLLSLVMGSSSRLWVLVPSC